MKTLLITFLTLITFFNTEKIEEIKTITATFDGYENGIYSFSDADKEIYYFNRIEDTVSKKFDLTGLDFVGDNFKISYRIELEDTKTNKKEIVHTIVSLNLVK